MKSKIVLSLVITTLFSISLFGEMEYRHHEMPDCCAEENHRMNGGHNFRKRSHHMMKRRPHFDERRYDSRLTQEQLELRKNLDNKYYSEIQQYKRDIFIQNQTINLELYKENPDEKLIEEAIEKKSKLSAELQKLKIRYYMELDKIYQK